MIRRSTTSPEWRNRPRRFRAALALALGCGNVVAADPLPATAPDDQWSVHFQATGVAQKHGRFASPYSGENSLESVDPVRATYTSTLFLGGRLWPGGAFFVNPEVAGGRGLSGTTGAGAFPNGEATRVGSPDPTGYFARYFVRQVIALPGSTDEPLASEANQIGGRHPVSNLTLTAGKFSALDIFDDNVCSHDPRTQFLSWALMANGAWDYPADTRGYTYGLAAELNLPRWSVRAGVFAVPREANGAHFDHELGRAHGSVGEIEWRYGGELRPGAVRALGFVNQARMGGFRDALALAPLAPDTASVRGFSLKYGAGLNVEQSVSDHSAVFSRIGWSDGTTENWMFTQIDRTVSGGWVIHGDGWSRPGDTFGVAGVLNGLSRSHRDYLAAGGYGFIVGDGRLNYGPEQVLEAYYSIRIVEGVHVTPDYQCLRHPGYNRDRGPAHIGSLRAHVEF